MPQTIISQFDRKYALPIETYRQVLNVTLRDSIPEAIRWEGMIVYVVSEQLSYVLVGGIDNTFWVELGTLVNVTVVDNLLSTSETDALSANQGRVLKDLIDNFSVDWGDIGGTLADQTDLQSALNAKANLSGATFTGDILVPDEAYGAGWNGSAEVPTKNAIYDKIETLPTVGGVSSVFGRTGAVVANSWDYAAYYEPIFSKNTAFNKNFGTTAGTVSEGNHTHTFASLTSKPTTIGGYGITNAYTKTETDGKYLLNTTDTLTGNFTATGDVFGGRGIFGGNGSPLRLIGSGAGVSNQNYIVFYENDNSTPAYYVGDASGGTSDLTLYNYTGSNYLRILGSGGADGLFYHWSGGSAKVWHAGNDGSGSGLDADLLDGVQGSNYARTDIAETFASSITASSYKTTNWEIVETGGVLQLKYGGVTKFEFNSSGVAEAADTWKLGL